jgi:hypothetical protein
VLSGWEQNSLTSSPCIYDYKKKQTRKELKATKEHTASRTGASKNMLVFTWNHLPRNKNRQVINI